MYVFTHSLIALLIAVASASGGDGDHVAFPEGAGDVRAVKVPLDIAGGQCRVRETTGHVASDRLACLTGPSQQEKVQGGIVATSWVPPEPPADYVPARPIDEDGWASADDYPDASARANEQGVVIVRVTIAASGAVEGCTVQASSGFDRLDRASCRAALRRARFEPALLAGLPVREVRLLAQRFFTLEPYRAPGRPPRRSR